MSVSLAAVAEPPDVVAAAAPLAHRAHTATERVLVVDDVSCLRSLVQRILNRIGYQTFFAAGVDEAREVVARHEIDVILTDIVMPGITGPELVKALVPHRPEMKVVYMSGYTEDAISLHGLLAPGAAFLPKPFTAQALNLKLREVLDA